MLDDIKARVDEGRPIRRVDVKYLIDRLDEAERKNKTMQADLVQLARESVKRDLTLAELEAEVELAISSMRWVSVSERLPEDDWEPVLVYRPALIGTSSYPIGIKVGGACGVDLARGNITHWMELPEPPEGYLT